MPGTLHAPSYLASLDISSGFIRLLERYDAKLHVVDTWTIPLQEIIGPHPRREHVQRTQFLNTGEGFLFSELIHKAFSLPETASIHCIVDLGTGSALPSLRAIAENKQNGRNLTLIGVDIDPEAIAIATHNAGVLGLEPQARFIQQDMGAFLKDYTQVAGQLIVSNPPYIPVPDMLDDPFFTPIQAGADGLKYLSPVLEYPWQPGTVCGVFASSLSSPAMLMKIIESSYRVLHLSAHLVPFGIYVSDARILPYLEHLKQEGQSTFGISEGKRYFVSIGLILQKK